MDKTVDKDFTDYLFQKANEAKRDIGYNPSYFLKMLGQDGGYQTAVKLLTPGRGVSKGFGTLFEHGRLDLSVEAICLDPRWAPYFEAKYLEEARKRLTKSSYQFKQEVATGSPWSKLECELVTADYFYMLKQQSENKPFSKPDHIAALIPKLNGRSAGSVGMKYSNISAILVEIGIPYLDGYKPLGNYQGILRETIESYVEENIAGVEKILDKYQKPVEPGEEPKSFEGSLEDAPAIRENDKKAPDQKFRPRKIGLIGLAARDLANKKLGDAGERYVFELEKERLISVGRKDLADKVRWISKDDGDGAGYDILSSETDGSARYIEVKTTNGSASTPFLITKNEYEFAALNSGSFHLYRVHSFSKKPRLFIIVFPIGDQARVQPAAYRVSF